MSESQEHLKQFQAADPHVQQIVASSKFVVTYLLQQDGASPGWRKANIEGPVYVVRRRVAPWYQLIVKNKNSSNNLTDFLHANWELDCQKNYIFYKVEDPMKRIRGLWFYDDDERTRLEGEIEKLLEESGRSPNDPPVSLSQPEPARHEPPPTQPLAQPKASPRNRGSPSVNVTQQGLSAALDSLADDDNFLSAVMHSLALNQPNQQQEAYPTPQSRFQR